MNICNSDIEYIEKLKEKYIRSILYKQQGKMLYNREQLENMSIKSLELIDDNID